MHLNNMYNSTLAYKLSTKSERRRERSESDIALPFDSSEMTKPFFELKIINTNHK